VNSLPTIAASLRDALAVPKMPRKSARESRSDGTMVDVDFSPRSFARIHITATQWTDA